MRSHNEDRLSWRQAMCDIALAPMLGDCCEVLGAFVAPAAYLPPVRAVLGSAALGSRAHRGALAFLAAALRGAGVFIWSHCWQYARLLRKLRFMFGLCFLAILSQMSTP